MIPLKREYAGASPFNGGSFVQIIFFSACITCAWDN